MSSVTISNLPAASSAGVNDLVASTQADGTTRKVTLGQITNLVPLSLAFLDLSDTPGSYAGQGEKLIAVNSSASGLEFVTGGAIVTARNGLTEFAGGDVRMGGVLTQLTEIGQPGDPWDWILEADEITVAADSKVAMTAATGDATIQTQLGNILLDVVNASANAQINSAGAAIIDGDGLVRVISNTQDVEVTATALDVEVSATAGSVNLTSASSSTLQAAAQMLVESTGGNLVLDGTDVNIQPSNDLNVNPAGNNIFMNATVDATLSGTSSVEVSSPGSTKLGNNAGTLVIEPGSVPTIGDFLVAQDALGTVDWETGGVGLQTANNGITENPVGNVQLGGALVASTIVGTVGSGFDLTMRADDINLESDFDIRLQSPAGGDLDVDVLAVDVVAINAFDVVAGSIGFAAGTSLTVDPGGAAAGFPPNVGDALIATAATGEVAWQQQIQLASWFLPFNAIADASFPLVGEISVIATGVVGDFSTTTAMRNTHLSITVNSITAGGDMVVSGDSIDANTGVVTLADTETVTVDTTLSTYQTDKLWMAITSVNVTAGSIVGIDYDIGRLAYIFDVIEGNSKIRIIGFRIQFQTNNNNSDLQMQMFIINDQGSKKFASDKIEDVLWQSTVGNGTITDNLRTGGDDRSYTSPVTQVASGDVFGYTIVDFNTFFTSDENVISQGLNDGFQVIFTGTAGGLNNIEHGTLTVGYVLEPA